MVTGLGSVPPLPPPCGWGAGLRRPSGCGRKKGQDRALQTHQPPRPRAACWGGEGWLWLDNLCGLGQCGGGGGAGRAHCGAAQTTGKGTLPRERATENPCPCGCQVPAPGQPGAQSAPDEQAAGWGGWEQVCVSHPLKGRALLLAPGYRPGSLPACLPEGGGPRSAHPHLSLFIFGCATWLVGSSFPARI